MRNIIIFADSYDKLDLVLPEEVFQIVWEALVSKTESIQYAKVFLPLSALLEGDFFNIYIKSGTFIAYICHIFQICSLISLGNVLMLSEGRPGVDNVFSLADGMQRSRLKEPGWICDRLGLSCSYPGHLFRRHFETGVG
jgi:ribonuclease P/MRP protein subunit RPP40